MFILQTANRNPSDRSLVDIIQVSPTAILIPVMSSENVVDISHKSLYDLSFIRRLS